MRGELYRRWLSDDRGMTLEEFVAERRGELRQQRAQRRMDALMGPLLQNAAAQQLAMQQQMAGIQHPLQQMRGGIPSGLLGGIFGW